MNLKFRLTSIGMVVVALYATNIYALDAGPDWSTVSSSSLSWPLNSLVYTSLFFDHDDSAGVPQDVCGDTKNPYKHLGIDIVGSKGQEIKAITDGVVRRSGSYGTNFGYYIVVESGTAKKWTTVYGHLNKDGRPAANTKVSAGTKIGTLYDMNADGDIPHLHLGIRPHSYDSSLNSDGGSVATTGYDCNSTLGFVDPLTYLTHKKYAIADDSDASVTAGPNWKRNRRANQGLPYPFYFKSGYSVLDATKNEFFQLQTRVPEDGNYYVHVRWTVEQGYSSNRGVALFKVKQNENELTKAIGYQSNSTTRGRWNKIPTKVYLTKKSPVIVIVSPYTNAAGKYIVADAAMFVAE